MQTVLENTMWLTVEETAEELGVSVGRVRQMLNAKEGSQESRLVGKKFGKCWAISRHEVNKAKGKNRRPGNPNFIPKTG